MTCVFLSCDNTPPDPTLDGAMQPQGGYGAIPDDMDSVLITKSMPGSALLEGEMYPMDQVARELRLDVDELQSRMDAGETVEANGVVVAPLLEEDGQQPSF